MPCDVDWFKDVTKLCRIAMATPKDYRGWLKNWFRTFERDHSHRRRWHGQLPDGEEDHWFHLGPTYNAEGISRQRGIDAKGVAHNRILLTTYASSIDPTLNMPSVPQMNTALKMLVSIEGEDVLMQKDPDDLVLIREVGKALVMTHDYNKAIKYYEQTLQDDPKLIF